MEIEELARTLEEGGEFTARLSDDVLIVGFTDSESTLLVVPIDGSLQIRQMVVENDEGYEPGIIDCIHRSLSKLNDRFTCCKIFFDEYMNVVNACDISSNVVTTGFVRDMLIQVEYVSQACSGLLADVIEVGREVSDDQIDRGFGTTRVN